MALYELKRVIIIVIIIIIIYENWLELLYLVHVLYYWFFSKISGYLNGKMTTNFQQSESVHTSVPGLYCSLCRKAFQTICGYKDHMQRHQGQYRFKCNLCNQGFMNKTNYMVHMNMHSNRRPYICSICGKGFFAKGTCKQHEKGHLSVNV